MSSQTDNYFSKIVKKFNKIGKPLLDHQLRGVRFLLNAENNGHGGLLCDDPGLGKTFQILSLILTSKKATSTLIVVPTSIIEQWKTSAISLLGKKRVYVYHGNKRNIDNFAKKRVIITTYGILKRDSRLDTINWERIILDEAHEIKNRKTKNSKAAMALNSKYRWGLSGTPFQNANEFKNLYRFVLGISKDSTETVDLVRLKKTHFLRRTKEEELKGKIPSIVISNEEIEFISSKEKKFYEKVQKNVRSEFEQLQQPGVNATQQNVNMFTTLVWSV